MNCDIIQKRLSAYLDRQMLTGERTDTEQHLRDCADCRADLESLDQVKRLLKTLPHPILPDAVRTAIETETIRRPTWQDNWRTWMIPVFALAAAGGWLFMHLHKPAMPVLSPRQMEAARPAAPETKHDLVAWHRENPLSKDDNP